MTIPSIDSNIRCHRECAQCLPDKMNIFEICCKYRVDDEADRPTLRNRVRYESKHIEQSTIESSTESSELSGHAWQYGPKLAETQKQRDELNSRDDDEPTRRCCAIL